MARRRFVVAPVGIADDHRPGILAVEDVVETQESGVTQRPALLVEADAQVGDGLGRCRLLGVAVLDIDLAAAIPSIPACQPLAGWRQTSSPNSVCPAIPGR